MEIIRGKIQIAKKVIIYGPEGIGKSTFASRFPSPLFIDTEGSTNNMDVARLPYPSSWTMLLQEIEHVAKTPGICRTLVIDTIDWAEQMCMEHICAQYHKSGIEDFGYGNGYVYTKEEFGRFLNRLTDVINAGIHVVLTAHAQIRKFEQPDELGAYDRYELKLGKKTSSQTSPLIKEWADMLLFANYKTFSVSVDDKGKKHKAQGGTRVMFTTHHPCWDAKNRFDLPEELPFAYSEIAHVIEPAVSNTTDPAKTEEIPTNVLTEPTPLPVDPEPRANKKETPEEPQETPLAHQPQNSDLGIPKALQDLMDTNMVSEEELQEVVYRRGYYPLTTLIRNYETDFINGVLVAAWPQVLDMILALRDERYQIPFKEEK